MIKIHVDRTGQKFLEQPGYSYEVESDGTFVCSGWCAGDVLTTRTEATEHARRVLRMRARQQARAITGES